MFTKRILASLILLSILVLSPIYAQNTITNPKEEFGFNIGDDYHLANYTQLLTYWKKLAEESDRMSLEPIGTTAEGRPMFMAIITSPGNHLRLDQYKQIAKRLALAEDLSDSQAEELSNEGRAVVWIDGGLHGTEVLGAQQLIELVYQMVSRNDPETLQILEDVILLAVCSNPDGMELVANWYMRETEPTKRSTNGLPSLYHKYIGHDNNRDFYMSTQPETEALNRILYREWFPQIVYNHHQTGPSGCVLFAPPFRDPFNYCYDPLIPVQIQLVGAAMHTRFVAEGKPGATMRSGAGYSIWWNGGLRTTVYFHNMIGILTETIGNPTPIEIPFLPQRQLPESDLPYPVAPQKWHFRQSVEYSITADRAILDIASKHRKEFLLNIYRMGKNSIERGSRDHWTIHPIRIQAVEEKIKLDKAQMEGTGRSRGYPPEYYEMLHDSAHRDPRGYIISSVQPDFLTATKFVNALIKTGITVYQANREFEVNGKIYPKDSYVIMTAQAFRPHILSMFEPQDYPDNIPCPGGPPVPTYDMAGWTLAYQMGVQFDRILDGFDGPFKKIEGFAERPAGKVMKREGANGYLLDHRVNDAFIAINGLLQSREDVYWLKQTFRASNRTYPAGTIYIPKKSSTEEKLEVMAKELGLNFEQASSKPSGEVFRLRPLRIGLWDRYGGSIDAGWIRWLFEQFEFPFELVYPQTLDTGELAEKFDVLIFVNGAIPQNNEQRNERFPRFSQPKPEDVPAEFRDRLGNVTIDKTVPQLLQFLKDGGTLLAIGSSTSIAYHAGLPLKNALVEKLQDGTEKTLSNAQIFIPGSLLRVSVDTNNPLAYGMPEKVDVVFNRSPVFSMQPEAALKGVYPVAWYDNKTPLRSGWGWGQHYLDGGAAIIEANVGKGKLFLYGPEVTFRGQPHGSFKFLFNGIYYGPARVEKLK
ncbi:MAG: M14 family metallopeptidase [Candidatus Aminicenantes bacterium]|nr:M14 family metallopeptidase [Candidatus Aminicenantes bacterium]MDH5383706.1 M14 family metallopeptidase [Candidatus Aminicenantes bacterium]